MNIDQGPPRRAWPLIGSTTLEHARRSLPLVRVVRPGRSAVRIRTSQLLAAYGVLFALVSYPNVGRPANPSARSGGTECHQSTGEIRRLVIAPDIRLTAVFADGDGVFFGGSEDTSEARSAPKNGVLRVVRRQSGAVTELWKGPGEPSLIRNGTEATEALRHCPFTACRLSSPTGSGFSNRKAEKQRSVVPSLQSPSAISGATIRYNRRCPTATAAQPYSRMGRRS